jgi:hypothetical protein
MIARRVSPEPDSTLQNKLARFQPKPEPKPGGRQEVMSNTTADLRRKINSAGDLQSVVRTMKALAASSIGQYEQSVRALGDYYRTWNWGWRMFPGKRPVQTFDCTGETSQTVVARSCLAPTRDWWASLMMWWPICGQDAGGSAGQPRSGPSVSAFMRDWRMRACRWWDSSPCRIPSRPSPRSSGRFLRESETRHSLG